MEILDYKKASLKSQGNDPLEILLTEGVKDIYGGEKILLSLNSHIINKPVWIRLEQDSIGLKPERNLNISFLS